MLFLGQAQPTFEYSGKLAAETNKVRGEILEPWPKLLFEVRYVLTQGWLCIGSLWPIVQLDCKCTYWIVGGQSQNYSFFTMLNIIWNGILLALAGVTLAFTEPPEARKPSTRWRLYVFKDGEPLNGEICSTTVFDSYCCLEKCPLPSMTSVWLLCDSGCMHDYWLESTIVLGMATSQLKLPRKSDAF